MDQPIPKTNLYQVGGDHYRAEYQHWDFAEDIGLGYLEGVLTKYVIRWQRKGGVEDLKKAVHYTEKLIELAKQGRENRAYETDGPMTIDNPTSKTDLTNKVCDQAGCGEREREILYRTVFWQTISELERIKSQIEDLIWINEGHPEIQDREGQDEDQSR